MQDDFSKNYLGSITIFGLGQVGLPTAVLAASQGYKVFGVDTNPEQLDKIACLDPCVIESSMYQLLQEQLESGSLVLQKECTGSTDFFLICVPTSLKDKKPDLSCLQAVFDLISTKIKPGSTIINESTTPVGENLKLAFELEKKAGLKLDKDFFMAYCPERLMPGQVLKELVSNDRIIGALSEDSAKKVVEFYSNLVDSSFYVTDAQTAEATKLIENSYRCLQVAFANQVSEAFLSIKLDPFEIIKLSNLHPRVSILNPGIGIGGDCIPVHPYFLKDSIGFMPSLVEKALFINEEKKNSLINEILLACDKVKIKKSAKPNVLVLGQSYKPDIADLRNSPAVDICKTLFQMSSFQTFVFDPICQSSEKIGKKVFSTKKDLGLLFQKADIVALLVGHKQFKGLLKDFNFDSKILIDPSGFFENTEFLSETEFKASKLGS